MKKLLTLALVLCSVVGFAQIRGGAQYDPGAARSNLSNVDATATPSMTSITLSDKIRAVWADILGDIYASGTVKVSTGTAAAPAYSFASDPNTGMYSPAADNLGVSVAGAEALRVNSAGEMLIATSTDAGDYKLQVNGRIYQDGATLNFKAGDTYISPLTSDGSDNGIIRLCGGGNSAGPNRGSSISLFGNESAGDGSITLRAGDNDGIISFNTTASDTERMRITSTGDVLIGTSTDAGDYKLQVNGNALFKSSNTFGTHDGSNLYYFNRYSGTDTDAAFYSGDTDRDATSGFRFITRDSTGLPALNTIMNGQGEVLIATSTDAGNYKLQVNGNVYVTNDVSALSFTDRTPAPENLAESYAIIQSHEVKGRMLDHSKLHSAAWGIKTRINTTGRMMKRKLDDGKEVLEPETETISEPDPNGRNLSITITAQALVIKDLIKRIEALEKNK